MAGETFYSVLKDDSAGANTIGPLVAAIRDYARTTRGAPTLELAFEPASHDATLLVYQHNVPPEARTGALAALARTGVSNGFRPSAAHLDEILEGRDADKRLFSYLGRMSRGAFPELDAVEYIVAQGLPLAGTRDGKTPWTAHNGFGATTINAGDNILQSGRRYVHLGFGFNQNSLSPSAGQVRAEDCDGIAPMHLAGDHALWPGFVQPATLWTDPNGPVLPWVQHAGNIWKRGNYQAGTAPFDNAVPLKDLDTTLSLSAIFENYWINKADSLAAMAPGYFWRESNVEHVFDEVLRSTGGVITDMTAAAADLTTFADVILFVAGAADGDWVSFGAADIFTTLHITTNASHVGDSYVLAVEVMKAGGVWELVPNFSWGTSNQFKTWNFSQRFDDQRIAFNDPDGWTQEVFNGSAPIRRIRFRKVSGTVGSAVTSDGGRWRNGNLYVWRPDGAPVTTANEPLHRINHGSGPSPFQWAGKKNYVIDQLRSLFFFAGAAGALDLTVKGGQHAGTSLQFSAGTYDKIHLIPGDDDPLFDTSDRTDRDGAVVDENHRWVAQDQVVRHGMPAATYANMKRWPEFYGLHDGPYAVNQAIIDWKIRAYIIQTGSEICNSRGLIFTNTGFGDHHCHASIGNADNLPAGWDVILCCLYVGQAATFYTQGTGNGNMPRDGSGASFRNYKPQGWIIAEYNGFRDSDGAQPLAGITVSGDSDTGRYDDGTGKHDGNEFKKIVLANLDGVNNIGTGAYDGVALHNGTDDEVLFEDIVTENCGAAIGHFGYRGGNGWGSCSAVIVVDDPSGAPAYTHLSDAVKASGDTPSLMFPADAQVGDYIVFMFGPHSMNRLNTLITTAAAGTFTLAFEDFLAGDTWSAVAGGNMTSAIFNSTGMKELRWNRPATPGLLTLDGEGPFHAFRVRLASGSFSTVPQLSEARTRDIGGFMKVNRLHVRKMPAKLLVSQFNATQYYGGSYTQLTGLTGELLPGQTIAAEPLISFAFDRTLASAQGVVKAALTTDAPKDTLIAQDLELTPGVDIVELPRDGSTVLRESNFWLDAKHSNNLMSAGRIATLVSRRWGTTHPAQSTAANRPWRRRSVGTYWLEYPGAGKRLICPASSWPADLLAGGGTIAAVLRVDGAGQNGEGRLFEKGDHIAFVNETSTTVDMRLTFRFDGADAILATTLTKGEDHVILIRGNLDLADNGDFVVTVDGEDRMVANTLLTSVQAPAGSHVSDAGDDFVLGDRAAGDRGMLGRLYHLAGWAAELGDTDAALVSEYIEALGEFDLSLAA